MTTPPVPEDQREKFTSKLPPPVRRQLKTAAVISELDIQDAATTAVSRWCDGTLGADLGEVSTFGATSFSTSLPIGLEERLKSLCEQRGVSVIQGLTRAVVAWVNEQTHVPKPVFIRRLIVCNQKGGVGKTAVTAAVGQAFAEFGLRVLLVDYDPQGHLTSQLAIAKIAINEDSLTQHMIGKAKGDLQNLIKPIPSERFGGRLYLLPACNDAFLLDPQLSTVRGRERALERALAPVEQDYDVIFVDCPPSLGMAVDAALYYAGRRDAEDEGNSGIIIPVQAEDSSAEAYALLTVQIQDLVDDLELELSTLGLVVNLYSASRGQIATSSLELWESMGSPPVLGVMRDLKEQREAERVKEPILAYAPDSDLADTARLIARRLS